MCIGGSVLSILTQFPSNRSQHVVVDDCRSKLVYVVSGIPQDSILGPLLFLLYISELFPILENKLTGYADDHTLMAVVPSPGVSVTVAEFLIRDLEHLITLLLPTFTLNFLHSHTLPNSLTNLYNFSRSATSAVSSASYSWFISNLQLCTAVPALSQAP